MVDRFWWARVWASSRSIIRIPSRTTRPVLHPARPAVRRFRRHSPPAASRSQTEVFRDPAGEARHQGIVNKSRRLHERVANRRADEAEATLAQRLAHPHAFFGG